MVEKKNECMQEAANSIYIANADEMVRQKCLAREEAERHERTLLRDIKVLKDEVIELKDENIELKDENASLKEELARLKAQLEIK